MLVFILYKIGRFLSVRLPWSVSYKIATTLGDLCFFILRRDRRTLYDNLKTIFPDKNNKEIKRISRELFRNFAKYLADFFRFDVFDRESLSKVVEFENIEFLDDAIKLNKGVIALSAHIGNWELGGASLGIMGYNLYAIALAHKDKRVNSFFNEQRHKKGVNVIQVGQNPTVILRYLNDNKIVAILGDRDFSGNGIKIDFFGKSTPFPKGAAFFSIKTGAPIVLVAMIRKNNNTFKLIFEKPIIPVTDVASDENMTVMIKEYISLLEKYIKLYPEQWFMFRRFWENNSLR